MASTDINRTSGDLPNTSNESREPLAASPLRQDYNRLKYYSALRTGYRHLGKEAKDSFLSTPHHVINPDLFVMHLGKSEDGKQSSLTTILSTWNTMVGSSVLALPWAYSQSGFLLGLLLSFGGFMISYYTCALILKTAKNDD